MSILYPDRCLYCGEIITEQKVAICKNCLVQLPVIKGERCKRCGAAITDCKCRDEKMFYDKNVSLMRYDGVAKSIIKRMKFNGLPQLATFMGGELSLLIKNQFDITEIDAITFVPMHFIKRIKRGYNQAELLAQKIGDDLNIPVVSLLRRKYSFWEQKDLNRKQRFNKMKDAMSAKPMITYKTVLLIDDVSTTGATLNACALALKQSGVNTVYTATFALTCKK